MGLRSCFRGSRCNNNNNNNGNASFVGYTRVANSRGNRIAVYRKKGKLITGNGRRVIRASIPGVPGTQGYYTENQWANIQNSFSPYS